MWRIHGRETICGIKIKGHVNIYEKRTDMSEDMLRAGFTGETVKNIQRRSA